MYYILIVFLTILSSSIFGSPWVGKYRQASVLHDYFYTRPKYGSRKIYRL